MKKIVFFFFGVLLIQCSTPTQKSMQVNGSVKGLRKGKLYLQKLEDTLLVTVDSITINGEETFALGHDIKSPEFYFLSLDKNDGDSLTDKILFFGNKGEITINTLLRTFSSSAKIEGSKNQLLWEEYQSMIRKFESKKLENLQKYINQESEQTAEERLEALDQANQQLEKRRYLFALNFAMNNADKELAAYIGAYEIENIVPLFRDSLYNKLSPAVKGSKYGLIFKQQLDSLDR